MTMAPHSPAYYTLLICLNVMITTSTGLNSKCRGCVKPAEWFWYDSTKNGSDAAKYLADYAPPKFQYQNFGSQLTMEFFNASEIADIVAGSGAK